ncbi:MAG: MFS transporter [Candidatus Wallbacteria bacterium]|nr:MFS transporter [Candidatus Wallbacteria bacterium]
MTQAAQRRALWLLGAAYAILGVNVSAVLVYGPLYIRQLEPERADLWISLLLALPSLTGFIGHNLWGVVYDRGGTPGRFALLSLVSEALLFALLLTTRSAAALVGLATVFSLFSTALFPAAKAWSTLVRPDGKGAVLGKLHAAESVGWAIGALAGGFASMSTADLLSVVRALFWFCLLGSAATAVLVAAAFPRVSAPAAPPVAHAVVSGLRALYGRTDLRKLSAFLFIVTSANVAFFTYISTYLCSYLGGSATLLSASMAGATVGGTLAFPIFGRLADTLGRRALLQGALAAYVLFYGTLCMVTDPVTLAWLYAIPIYPAIRIATNAWLADLTEARERASGMGLLEGVGALASVAGPIVGWLFVSRLGHGVLPLVPLVLLLPGLAVLFLMDRPPVAASVGRVREPADVRV